MISVKKIFSFNIITWINYLKVQKTCEQIIFQTEVKVTKNFFKKLALNHIV